MEAVLKQCDFFHDLTTAELKIVISCGVTRKYARGVTIFSQGDTGTDIFVMLDGKVDILVDDPVGKNLNRKHIFTIKQANLFGELAFLADDIRSASAVTITPVEVLVISAEALKAKMTQDPQLGYKLMTNLAALISRRLKNTTKQLRSAIFRSNFAALDYY
jgi:CRP/FNR family cyclic AMP-dependent transcriptional regulator